MLKAVNVEKLLKKDIFISNVDIFAVYVDMYDYIINKILYVFPYR